MRTVFVSVLLYGILVLGAVVRAEAAGGLESGETPQLPSISEGEVSPAAGSETPETAETTSHEWIWAAERYAALPWQRWETRVEAWFDGLAQGEEAEIYPPTPPGTFFVIGQTLEELPLPFPSFTNEVAAVMVETVPTWGVSVREEVSETGARQLLTLVGRVVVHAQPVRATFDPEVWSLSVYNRRQPLPAWLADDAELRQTWFSFRGRERLGMACTFVAPGKLAALTDALRRRAEEQAALAAADERDPEAFSFLKIVPEAHSVGFDFYNPKGVLLGLLTQASLEDSWDYRGRIPMDAGQSCVHFDFTRLPRKDPRFFKVLDLSTDSDGDGIPDGLEVAYFKTDPDRRDTTACGMDDWSKIYLYGLDPTIPDNDGDGILDGEDEAPGTPGPEIIMLSPGKRAVYYTTAKGATPVSLSGYVRPAGVAKPGVTRTLSEVRVNARNLLAYNAPAPFESNYTFSEQAVYRIGKHRVTVDVVQDGTPVLRARKTITFEVMSRGPALHVIAPAEGSSIPHSNVAIKTRVEAEEVEVYCNNVLMTRNGYYRFCVLAFPDAAPDQQQTVSLRAVSPTEGTTLQALRFTITRREEEPIVIDHIMNTGKRIFTSPLDGMPVEAVEDAMPRESLE